MAKRINYDRRTGRDRHRNRRRTQVWVAIGAVVLIILLILWLTMADFAGDTDVAAMITPPMS